MEKVGKKGKKKQAKDELDRQKQAEKKRRRLEKALATSAAIRSELEKKKQKKIEEQQRLDKEGAAIAEAVALHVLSGEDTEESHHIVLSNDEIYDPLDHSGNLGLFTGYQSFAYPPQVVYVREMQSPFYEEACQAVGLLQIADDSQGAATFFINKMLSGDFFKEF